MNVCFFNKKSSLLLSKCRDNTQCQIGPYQLSRVSPVQSLLPSPDRNGNLYPLLIFFPGPNFPCQKLPRQLLFTVICHFSFMFPSMDLLLKQESWHLKRKKALMSQGFKDRLQNTLFITIQNTHTHTSIHFRTIEKSIDGVCVGVLVCMVCV